MSEDEQITPPDPAGTQPKVDRDALLPARIEPAEQARDEPPAGPLPLPVDDVSGVGEPRELHEAPHAARFNFLLGALLAVGVVAIAGLIWAVGQNGSDTGPTWSPWKPAGEGVAAAQEIAAHVGPQYKAANGTQLVHIEASDLKVGDVELKLVEREAADAGGEILRLNGDAVMFRMTGLGKAGAIPGKPTVPRGLLLQREAIEIAGYAFRYLPDLDYAVFLMPPTRFKPEDKPTMTLTNRTLAFRRGDLAPILGAPLRTTFRAPPPTVKAIEKAPELPLVATLGIQREFFYSLSESPTDNSAFLVLDKQPAASDVEAATKR